MEQLTRIQYLKKMLLHLQYDPKKFMFEVTCNTPIQTETYHFINHCYQNDIPFIEAKTRIKKRHYGLIV